MRTAAHPRKLPHLPAMTLLFLSRLGGTLLLAIYHLSPNDFRKSGQLMSTSTPKSYGMPKVQVGNPEPNTFYYVLLIRSWSLLPVGGISEAMPKAMPGWGPTKFFAMVWYGVPCMWLTALACCATGKVVFCPVQTSQWPINTGMHTAYRWSARWDGSNWPISMICQASRCSWYRPAPRQRPQTRERCLFVAELQRLWGQTSYWLTKKFKEELGSKAIACLKRHQMIKR